MPSRFFVAALGAAALLVPSLASARPWHGLTPGVSSKADVVKKFGSPSRELAMTAADASGLVYQAKAAQDYGAEEAQFFFDAAGKLTRIYVFPQVALKREDVIKAWGVSYDERRTDDFKLYFQYRTEGFVVFFDKDNETVFQLQFTPATATAAIATPPPATPPVAVMSPTPAPAASPAAAKTATK